MLHQTISVKIKYEKIIGKLINEPSSRSKTIEFIRESERSDELMSEPKTQSEKVQQNVVHLGEEVNVNKLAQISQS